MTMSTLSSHTYYNAAELAAKCKRFKATKTGFMCQCPSHDDGTESLSITDGNKKTLLTCHAGCKYEDVIAQFGVKRSSLYREPPENRLNVPYRPPPASQPVAPIAAKAGTAKPSDPSTLRHFSLGTPEEVYPYPDEDGVVRYAVARFEGKKFLQARPNGNGGWEWGRKGTDPLLFRLEQLIEGAAQDKLIVIPEGEKDVLRLESLGFVATCNSGGARKFPESSVSHFRNARVAILPDNDETGKKHAHEVADLLIGIAASVKVVELDNLPEKGKDVSDWFDAGHTVDELTGLIQGTPRWGEKPRRIQLIDEDELNNLKDPGWIADGWIPASAYATLFGESGAMKTFAALDLALSIALGLEWHGVAVKQGPVVYIVAEGLYGMKRRVAAWRKYHGVTGKLPIYFLKRGIAMMGGSDDVSELIAEINEKVKPPPLLVVVDTLARNFVGNENATEDMNKYVAGCDQIKAATGATILSVHHSGLTDSERGRGNSANKGALDTEIMASKDGYRVTLKCKKQKDAPELADISFEAIPVAGSLVLKPMDQTGGKLDGNRLLCLQVVHRSETGLSHAEWKRESGLEKKNSSFNAALRWLQDMAYVNKAAERRYVITDAGKMVLSPSSIGSPSVVHSGGVIVSPRGGGVEHPTVDKDQQMPIASGVL